MVEVRFESELRKVLRLLAARATCELVISDVASDAKMGRGTAAKYVQRYAAGSLSG
jgi:hypothetical protein